MDRVDVTLPFPPTPAFPFFPFASFPLLSPTRSTSSRPTTDDCRSWSHGRRRCCVELCQDAPLNGEIGALHLLLQPLAPPRSLLIVPRIRTRDCPIYPSLQRGGGITVLLYHHDPQTPRHHSTPHSIYPSRDSFPPLCKHACHLELGIDQVGREIETEGSRGIRVERILSGLERHRSRRDPHRRHPHKGGTPRIVNDSVWTHQAWCVARARGCCGQSRGPREGPPVWSMSTIESTADSRWLCMARQKNAGGHLLWAGVWGGGG